MAEDAILNVFRGDKDGGKMVEYRVPMVPGMVVLDAVHSVQAMHSPDLAVRWNCKAGKCGSCSAEVNGRPRLMCMDRMDQYPSGESVVVRPMKAFPVMKDLVTDVSWNYDVNRKIPAVLVAPEHFQDCFFGHLIFFRSIPSIPPAFPEAASIPVQSSRFSAG